MGQILNYHKVMDKFEWGLTRVTLKQFEKQCQYLSENGFESLTFAEFCKNEVSNNDKKFAITFDDGYESVFENAFPILKKFGFKATVFVITNFIDKENSWDVSIGRKKFNHLSEKQILELDAKEWEIASHTCNHKSLSHLNENDLKYELQNSKERLESLLGKKILSIAYPFGIFDKKVIKFAETLGYKYGTGNSFSFKTENPKMQITRFNVYLSDTLNDFVNKLESKKFEQRKLRLINFCANGTVVVKRWRDFLNRRILCL